MTIEKLESVKELIKEIGEDNIIGIFRYRHSLTHHQLYAVFTEVQYIDIYHSPFCEEIETIFYNGKWEKELK